MCVHAGVSVRVLVYSFQSDGVSLKDGSGQCCPRPFQGRGLPFAMAPRFGNGQGATKKLS